MSELTGGTFGVAVLGASNLAIAVPEFAHNGGIRIVEYVEDLVSHVGGDYCSSKGLQVRRRDC